MSITNWAGPIGTRRSNSLGSVGTFSANQNPDSGPCFWEMGDAQLDLRVPFTYQPGMGTYVGGTASSPAVYVHPSTNGLQVLDQVPSALSANNIATAQTPVAATPLTITAGTGITGSTSITRADTGATVTGLYAIDTAMAPLAFGQSGAVNVWDPTKAVARNIRVTSDGNDSASGVITVSGYDLYGYPMSEAIACANAGVASGKKAFKYIASLTPSGTFNSTAMTVGTGDVYGLPLRADRIPYVQAWWGNPQSLITGPGGTVVPAEQEFTVAVPALANVVNSQIWEVPVPFDFTILRAGFIQTVATTTGSKAATFTVGINGTAVGTGGVISVTSNAATGIIFPATAISGTGISSTASTSVVTITIASPGVVTWPNHGLVAGTPVVFSGGTLPTGLTAGTTYYVISAGLTTNAFEVSTSSGGSAVNTTGSQSGTHTATAINMITFTASSVTTFSEGAGNLYVEVVNNSQSGGTFTAADATTATTTTGDTRGTIAMPNNSDGSKRLTLFITPNINNMQTNAVNALYGIQQNLATTNGS